jgi:hypothetical protein
MQMLVLSSSEILVMTTKKENIPPEDYPNSSEPHHIHSIHRAEA